MPKRGTTVKRRSEGFLIGNRFMFKTNKRGLRFPTIIDRKMRKTVGNYNIRRSK